MHPQLTLPFEQQNSMSFASFYGEANSVVQSKLREIAHHGSDDSQLFLWGPANSGKTHLLHASCQSAVQKGYRIAYLLAAWFENCDITDGLADFDLICIDDLQELPDTRESELALFNLVNNLRENGGKLVCASRDPLSSLSIELPDLRTRISWGAVFAIQPLDATEIREVLETQAQNSGLALGSDVIDYLLNHYPRDIATQTSQLRELDNASLQAQRRITIPLVKQVLSGGG